MISTLASANSRMLGFHPFQSQGQSSFLSEVEVSFNDKTRTFKGKSSFIWLGEVVAKILASETTDLDKEELGCKNPKVGQRTGNSPSQHSLLMNLMRCYQLTLLNEKGDITKAENVEYNDGHSTAHIVWSRAVGEAWNWPNSSSPDDYPMLIPVDTISEQSHSTVLDFTGLTDEEITIIWRMCSKWCPSTNFKLDFGLPKLASRIYCKTGHIPTRFTKNVPKSDKIWNLIVKYLQAHSSCLAISQVMLSLLPDTVEINIPPLFSSGQSCNQEETSANLFYNWRKIEKYPAIIFNYALFIANCFPIGLMKRELYPLEGISEQNLMNALVSYATGVTMAGFDNANLFVSNKVFSVKAIVKETNGCFCFPCFGNPYLFYPLLTFKNEIEQGTPHESVFFLKKSVIENGNCIMKLSDAWSYAWIYRIAGYDCHIKMENSYLFKAFAPNESSWTKTDRLVEVNVTITKLPDFTKPNFEPFGVEIVVKNKYPINTQTHLLKDARQQKT
ncbi:major viral coat protein [Scheffersomyces xylosifermentans]|uniref:major viral coat protein n=1 Tax=Scheffersomyces xylosifermentans TaxID=1304137 RepID=UPI00315CFC86